MLQTPFALSPDEHRSISVRLASTKKLFSQIADTLKKRLPFDQQIVVRAGEVEAAIQRLESQLEHELGQVPSR